MLTGNKSKSNAAISKVCRPAVERWQGRYTRAQSEYLKHKELHVQAKSARNATQIANTDAETKEAKREIDALALFKSDLGSFTRYYEFMSQIVDNDSHDLEKLSPYARHLAPLLRERTPDEDPVDLSSVSLTHYRLSKIKQQDLLLVTEGGNTGLEPGTEIGTSRPRDT